MPSPEYSLAERRCLLQLARQSITHGLHSGETITPDLEHLSPALGAIRACFVTLKLLGELRGCIGSLERRRPLAEETTQMAFQAAFHDPRFQPVTGKELDRLDIEISVLSPLEALSVNNEPELLHQLAPGIDGLVLEEAYRRSTFLPKVWDHIKEPRQFLAELKLKGGWPCDYWSDDIKVYRYRTETWGPTI